MIQRIVRPALFIAIAATLAGTSALARPAEADRGVA